MTTLSAGQVAAAAKQAGFTGTNLILAVAMAKAESGWNTTATNHNTNGSTDYGLWQINSVHSDLLRTHNWQDPVQNAMMAKAVFDSAGGQWTPWTTFNTGAYRPFLTESQRGVQTANGGVAIPLPSVTGQTASLVSGTSSIVKFFAVLGDKNFWIRQIMLGMGGALVLIGLVLIGWDNPTVSKAVKTTGKAVGVAAIL